ncbi:MAG TPA: SMP-30/gluconolactonase/LRE family protein [Armatimonadota bacterium]|nr:SMP-30/gluconolactonase/LRE family protein [Armatimonadota bacterium]
MHAGATRMRRQAPLPDAGMSRRPERGRAAVLLRLAALFAAVAIGTLAALPAHAEDSVPVPWDGIDIGSPPPTGSASWANGTFTVKGAGAIGSQSDAFHFVYQGVTGDFVFTARVASGAGGGARAGLMVRDALAPNTHFVGVLVAPGGRTTLEYRTPCRPGAGSAAGGGTAPGWLRLVKRGGAVRAFAAPDVKGAAGQWQRLGADQTTESGMVYVGMCAFGQEAEAPAVFDHVSLQNAPLSSLDNMPDTAALAASTPTHYQLGPDSVRQPGVPRGEMFQFELAGRKYYPGTQSTIWVYVPAEYNPAKPACLCVGLDGPGFHAPIVFDNLIYRKQMPVTIGVFISSGTVDAPGTKKPIRFDRCYEFDSVNDNFDRFLVNEVLPAVEQRTTADGRAIRISADPNDHMIEGGSSGGVCAFTAAWQRPDLFRRVFTAIGTYVGMRGADSYPTLVRKTEPKPIRIFLQDGAQDAWNPLFDSWWTQNRSMEESLRFAGYDVNHSWGTLGHEETDGDSVFPEAVTWLWRDYPKPIETGRSGNSMLRSVLAPGQSWQPMAGPADPAALAAGPGGSVFCWDAASHEIDRIEIDGALRPFAHTDGAVAGEACGPDGRLYVATEPSGDILVYDAAGKPRVADRGVHADHLVALSTGEIYATQPGPHDDVPGKVWLIRGGAKTMVDTGLHHASGVIAAPDHALLFVADAHTHWIYSYVIRDDGALEDRQPFYWLHAAESPDDTGDYSQASDMALDEQGDLFVATRMGVQICDRNGRVEGILSLPAGRVTSLCFGGANLHDLYVVCGRRIYRRALQATGVPGWAAPMAEPRFGAG